MCPLPVAISNPVMCLHLVPSIQYPRLNWHQQHCWTLLLLNCCCYAKSIPRRVVLVSPPGTTGRFVQYMSFLQDLEEVVLLGPEVRGRVTAELRLGGL